jgi:hypothetical protein
MKIRDFGVEIWMNRFEKRCDLNLAETCVASLTVDELLTIANNRPFTAIYSPRTLSTICD